MLSGCLFKMLRSISILFIMTSVMVACQRPFFAGTRPIGYPETPNRTTTPDSLSDRFGDGTTEKLPLEANGDRDLVDRLSKLPLDKQPFWFINWKALEELRKNPQTYPQSPNMFIDPLAQPANLPPSNNNEGITNGFSNSNINNQGFSNGIAGSSNTDNRNPGSLNTNQGFLNMNNQFSNPNTNNQGFANTVTGPTKNNPLISNTNQGFTNINNQFSNPNNAFINSNPGITNSPVQFSNNNANSNGLPSSGITNSINGITLPNILSSNTNIREINSNSGFANPNGNFNLNSAFTNSNAGQISTNTEFTNQRFSGISDSKTNIAPGISNLTTNSQFGSSSSQFSTANVSNRFGEVPTTTNSSPGFTYNWNNAYHHAAFFNHTYNYKTNPTFYVKNSSGPPKY